jgi:hypothetical protein
MREGITLQYCNPDNHVQTPNKSNIMLLGKRFIPPPPSNATCQVCQDLKIRPAGARDGFLDIRLQDLPGTAQSGCVMCRILHESVTDLLFPLRGFQPLPDEEVFGITLHSKAGSEPHEERTEVNPLAVRAKTEHAVVAELEIYTHTGERFANNLI